MLMQHSQTSASFVFFGGLFGFGVELFVDFFEVLVGNVGVNLGSGDVGVSEHGLDGADVGAVHEEVGGEAMAQGMWGNVFGDAGHFGVFLDDAFDGTRGETAVVAGSIDRLKIATIIEKKGSEGIGASIEIILDPVGGSFGDENGTIFAAFATNDKLAAVEIDGIAIEFDEFGDTEPAGEKELNNGAVAKPSLGVGINTIEKTLNFVIMEEGNLLANDVRKFDEIGIEGINAALGEVFEKTAEGDEMIGLSDGLEIFSVAVDFTIELKTVLA